MLMLPLQLPDGDFHLLIVLEDDNLARMKQYDPAEIVWSQMGQFASLKPKTIQITYGSPDDVQKMTELARQGKAKQAVELVTRGWKFRPDAGDHDFGPVSLTKKPD